MQKLLSIFLFIILFIPNIYALEKEKAVSIYKEKLIIADFVNRSSWKKLGSGLTDDIMTLFVKTKRFDIIERKKLKSILQEQELQLSGLVNTEDAVKVGNLIGAKYIITGSITSADATHREKEVIKKYKDRATGLIRYKKYIVTTWEGRLTISARLVEIETGKVLIGKTVTGHGRERHEREKDDKTFLESILTALVSKDENKAKVRYFRQIDQKVINTARSKAAHSLVSDFLKEFPLSGYIISKTEDKDYLVDLGTGNGMNSEVNLKVLGKSKKMTHPVTGEVMQVRKRSLGYLKVIDLGSTTSRAKLVRGDEDDMFPGLKVEVVKPVFIWHRAFASFLIPGLGQFLEKRWGSGILFLLGEGALLGGAYLCYLHSTDDYLKDKKLLDTKVWPEKGTQVDKARKQALVGMWIFIGFEVILHIWDTIDAGYPAQKNDAFAYKQAKYPTFAFKSNDYENKFYLRKTFRF